jgi:hypothetical protein
VIILALLIALQDAPLEPPATARCLLANWKFASDADEATKQASWLVAVDQCREIRAQRLAWFLDRDRTTHPELSDAALLNRAERLFEASELGVYERLSRPPQAYNGPIPYDPVIMAD